MDKNLYEDIHDTITRFKGLSRDCLSCLQVKYPELNTDTLASMTSTAYQHRMKHNFWKSPTAEARYYMKYLDATDNGDNPGIIVRLAEKSDIAPCLLAKLILQRYYQLHAGEENDKSVDVRNYLKDTTLINDTSLAFETYLAVLYDDLYSPTAEIMKNSIGQQYEIKLHREIKQLGLTFKDEEDLRKSGYDKTPDIKLEIPIAIDGFVVHWIESKALFADEETHKEYIKNQYSSYWNRFGPGLVIYWFGYVVTISNMNDRRFIVRQELPKDIVKLDFD